MKDASEIPAEPVVVRLEADQAPRVIDVFCEAFHDYPVMQYVLGGGTDDYDRRLTTLVGFFVMARALRDEPLLGIPDGADLGAAAIVSFPDRSESPPELASLREQVWAELGTDARARYEEFSSAYGSLLATAPRIHLNMIGTRRGMRGQGQGRRLLEHVHLMSQRDPESRGVSLTTEDPANLPLYERFGYAITGHARVSPELETWSLFRPDEPGDC